ncbi:MULTISPECIES: hypothetical protein [Vibrio harveyi group]|nr:MULTISPECIES: hypothetical protein [Vibrio harveyi group]EHA6959122.1 hypothetical protein [Vibrio parahaemolyticus]EHA6974715.1 hypothetical protein [Vibrio parahaemolyticus]EHA6976917.1 hypothetical protein [Vibrio parahaemolyticus]MBM4972872.1 hypothetical protein [Vibrio parahaemolyticus]MCR9667197.1 hypothetical protein [Vibrio parahaemolyticus]
MSIFKKINNELTDNVTAPAKQKKSPLPRFQKNKSGKMLYIIVRDPELTNSSGNATHVTLIKLPITAPTSPRSIKHLIAEYGTDEAKSGKYEITDHNFEEIMSHFKPANELYKKYRKEELHEKQSVVINEDKHSLCAIAAKLHEAVEMFDELESEDEINAEEAQELHQALYRMTLRLNAAKFPVVMFNDHLFSLYDSNNLQAIRAKRKSIASISHASNLKRFAPHASTLTPFNHKQASKKVGKDAQKLIEYLAKAGTNTN